MVAEQHSTPLPRSNSPFAGRWRNQRGSVMDVRVGDDDTIEGTFRTLVGTDHPERAHHLVGYVIGDAVTFCVDFRPHGSVAAWTGHHTVGHDGVDHLTTAWHLAQPARVAEEARSLWRGLLTGADEFVREP